MVIQRCKFLRAVWLTASITCMSCAPDHGHPPDLRSESDAGQAGTPDASLPADPHCVAPEGVSTAPQTISDVVTLVNALLPAPVSVPCFVETLARPLALQAVDSEFSAQPAESRRSPRVFLFFPGLTLSVVPAGMGAHLLELGEHRPDDKSLKAELEFPIETRLDEASPYARVYYDENITTCGFCHQGEAQEEGAPSPLAYVSPSLRPQPYQRVPLDELRMELATCDADTEPERCALLHALFDQRPDPVEHDFPESYKTFF